MDKITRDTLIPKELADELVKENYRLWKKGVPVKEAIEIGLRRVLKFWKERYVNKSGG